VISLIAYVVVKRNGFGYIQAIQQNCKFSCYKIRTKLYSLFIYSFISLNTLFNIVTFLWQVSSCHIKDVRGYLDTLIIGNVCSVLITLNE